MIKLRRIVAILSVALLGLTSVRADDAADIASVKAADDARVAAMIAADGRQLDLMLSDGLRYTHSVKLVEDKTAHIEALTSRRLIYREVNYQTRDFRVVAPGVVIMTGGAMVNVGTTQMMWVVDINFLGVWRREDKQWRLFAWQSGRNKDATPVGPLEFVSTNR